MKKLNFKTNFARSALVVCAGLFTLGFGSGAAADFINGDIDFAGFSGADSGSTLAAGTLNFGTVITTGQGLSGDYIPVIGGGLTFADFASSISWENGVVTGIGGTTPPNGETLWAIGDPVQLASFVWDSGTVTLTDNGGFEIVGMGILSLSGKDDTAGTFWLNETGGSFSANNTSVPPDVQVPLPAAAWLFGSALLGLVAVGRRRAAV